MIADRVRSTDEQLVRALHQSLLDAWNRRNPADFAALFAADGTLIGFDGSTIDQQSEIDNHLRPIFANHPTAAFIGIVRSVRFPTVDTAILHAVVGMVPPGKSDINPAVNAVQTLVATRKDGTWRIVLFQNTPAAFHGRPEEQEKLTAELRQALRNP